MKTLKSLLVFCVSFQFIAIAEVAPYTCEASEVSAKTSSGCIVGKRENSGRESFLGVPYAKAPTGNLRFRRPEPHPGWRGVRMTREYGNSCIQYAPAAPIPGNQPPAPESEDCLFLNIWRPRNAKNLPVLFFIHGSGSSNSGADPVYGVDPQLAKNAVVVTINYRLGLDAGLAHPELSAENPDNTSGSLGIYDAIAALKWTKENARALGGDPQKILLFGQSYGALAVRAIMVSPKASGLFTGVALHSGPFFLRNEKNSVLAVPPLRDSQGKPSGEAAGEVAVSLLGCDPLPPKYTSIPQCLRSKSTADLKAAFQTHSKDLLQLGSALFYVDKTLIPDQPVDLLKSGQFNRTPITVGHTKVDASAGCELAPATLVCPPKTAAEVVSYIEWVGENNGIADIASLVELYDPADYEGPADTVTNFSMDITHRCGTRSFLREMGRYVSTRGFVYNYVTPSLLGILTGPAHLFDFYYLFGSRTFSSGFNRIEKRVASRMQSAWTALAANIDPFIEGLGQWPTFSEEEKILDINREFTLHVQDREKQCDFLDSQGIY